MQSTKKRSYINCYTIKSTLLGLSINPGISNSVFGIFPKASTSTLHENLICRFAVENDFKKIDPLLQTRWIVVDSCDSKSFYRFFNSIPNEANNFIYLLVTYDIPEELPHFLNKNAIIIDSQKALIKMRTPVSNEYFTFKGKNFCLTPFEIYMY